MKEGLAYATCSFLGRLVHCAPSTHCFPAASATTTSRFKVQLLIHIPAYWIAFGPHGPRALPPPGENWKVFRLTMYGVFASLAIFMATRMFARGPPRTMTKEYQEATNEYMKVRTVIPLTTVGEIGHRHCRSRGRGMRKPLVGLKGNTSVLTYISPIGAQHRAYHRCLQRGLRRQGSSADRPVSQGPAPGGGGVRPRTANLIPRWRNREDECQQLPRWYGRCRDACMRGMERWAGNCILSAVEGVVRLSPLYKARVLHTTRQLPSTTKLHHLTHYPCDSQPYTETSADSALQSPALSSPIPQASQRHTGKTFSRPPTFRPSR